MPIQRRLSTPPAQRKNIAPVHREIVNRLLRDPTRYIFYDRSKCYVRMDATKVHRFHATVMCGLIVCGLVKEFKPNHYRVAD